MERFFGPVEGGQNFAHILVAALDLGPSVYIDLACVWQGWQAAPAESITIVTKTMRLPNALILFIPDSLLRFCASRPSHSLSWFRTKGEP